jgi:hypothetical protein
MSLSIHFTVSSTIYISPLFFFGKNIVKRLVGSFLFSFYIFSFADKNNQKKNSKKAANEVHFVHLTNFYLSV